MEKYFILKRAFLIVFITVIIILVHSVYSKEKYEYNREINGALNTVSYITVVGDTDSGEIADKCVEIVNYYDRLLSATNTKSDVYRINNSPDAVSVSKETVDIIKNSGQFFYDTNGKFDITIGALSDLWNDVISTSELPRDEEIKRLCSLSDYSSLIIDDKNLSILRTVENQKVNLGAVAKGYISDKIREVLLDEKIMGAMINLGGNIYAHGRKVNGEKWRVGICNPRNTDDVIGTLELENKFVITSGDYERYTEIDGVRYHHIIDAKTGYPSKSKILSSTIICDNGFLADALSTSCFLLGLDGGVELCKKYGVDAIFVTEDNKIYYSKGLENIFEKTAEAFEYIYY